jgi:hypothetical protein
MYREHPGSALLHEPAVARACESGVEHGMRAADGGMSGERDFTVGGKNAQAITGRAAFRRQHEGRFDQIRPSGDVLHFADAQIACVNDDAQRIAAARRGRKHIQLQVAESRHAEARVENAHDSCLRPALRAADLFRNMLMRLRAGERDDEGRWPR